MNKKLETFCVQAKLDLIVSISIRAENLEDAVRQSKELKETDFVDIKEEYIDGSLDITGIYK